MAVEDSIVCTVSMRNGDSYNMEFNQSQYWNSEAIADAPFENKTKNLEVSW